MKSNPLFVFPGRQYIENYAKDPDVARAGGRKAAHLRKLMAYYAKAGFREIGQTGRMAPDPSMIGPMDKRGDSWAEVTLKRAAAMEKYQLRGTDAEGGLQD